MFIFQKAIDLGLKTAGLSDWKMVPWIFNPSSLYPNCTKLFLGIKFRGTMSETTRMSIF